MATVNEYPVKSDAELDDYVCVGKHNSTYKISVGDLITNLQSGRLKSDMGASNAGKMLSIGIDGSVVLIDPVN